MALDTKIKASNLFSRSDVQEIRSRGISCKQVLQQLERFKKGFPKPKLARPCFPGDGVVVLAKADQKRCILKFQTAAARGRAMKFVPASGAASRMFKAPSTVLEQYRDLDLNQLRRL